MSMLTVTWHGHSCFSAEADGFCIVFDPYSPDSVPGLKPLSLTADLVLSSHGHKDHQCPEAVSLWQRNGLPVSNRDDRLVP